MLNNSSSDSHYERFWLSYHILDNGLLKVRMFFLLNRCAKIASFLKRLQKRILKKDRSPKQTPKRSQQRVPCRIRAVREE